MTTASHDWYVRTQGATITLATHHRDRWTRDDVEFVATFTDEVTDEELAYATGRTLASIWNLQHRVRTEGVEGVIASYDAPRVVVATCPVHHVALPATGVCDWC